MPRDALRQLDDEASLARLITDHAVEAIFLVDGEGRTIFANPAAEAMFGWTAEELRQGRLSDILSHRPALPAPLWTGGFAFDSGSSLRRNAKSREDVFVHRDGHLIPVSLSNAPIIRDGVVTGGVLIVRDITERRKLMEQRQLMMEELQHRVKNLLTVVQAIANQSLGSGDIEAARAGFFTRLAAIGEAQSLLMDREGMEAPIHEVLGRALRPFQRDEASIGMWGPAVTLPPRRALTLSMAMHELGTNATKYGALSEEGGRVAISWRCFDADGHRGFELVWRESGGPPVEPPARRGFGTRMIERALAADFEGHVELLYRPEGLLCTLTGRLS